MIYTINLSNYTTAYKEMANSRFKLNAWQRINYFPVNTTEKLLDKYLQEHYQITFKYACYLLVLHCKTEVQKDELTVTIADKKLDKLARIITYGTGKLSGSRILSFIFGRL